MLTDSMYLSPRKACSCSGIQEVTALDSVSSSCSSSSSSSSKSSSNSNKYNNVIYSGKIVDTARLI
jgi:hypothetical protein